MIGEQPVHPAPFKAGDRVAIIPHRDKNEDGTVKETFGIVTNPHDPTDMKRLDGTPVGHYVRLQRVGARNDLEQLGYHEASLEHAP
jgi:hypothetical protein